MWRLAGPSFYWPRSHWRSGHLVLWCCGPPVHRFDSRCMQALPFAGLGRPSWIWRVCGKTVESYEWITICIIERVALLNLLLRQTHLVQKATALWLYCPIESFSNLCPNACALPPRLVPKHRVPQHVLSQKPLFPTPLKH